MFFGLKQFVCLIFCIRGMIPFSIFIFNQDFHIHAYIYADHWKIHADKINEGGVYLITNFYAKEASGSLKPVSSKYMINFSPSTTVERVADDTMISNHKFEFVDLSELFSVASSFTNTEFPEFAIG